MKVAEMGVVLFAANEGFLEDVDIDKVLDFQAALVAYMNAEHSEFMREANETGVYSDEVEDTMRKALETFKSTQTW